MSLGSIGYGSQVYGGGGSSEVSIGEIIRFILYIDQIKIFSLYIDQIRTFILEL